MRFLSILSAIMLLTTPLFGQKNSAASARVNERIEYINQFKDLAISQMNQYGIPASITLAQACLESGNGKSTLAKKANNHFGIKCHNNWNGPKIRHDDDAKNECFRVYKSAEESFRDHAEFLKNNRRYASLFDLSRDDYKKWAHGLKAAGYATNPNYAKEVINIIEDYELYRYDSKKYTEKISYTDLPKENIINAERDILIEGIAENAVPLESSHLYSISTNRQLYTEDDRAYIFANEGDTYKAIAKEYNLFTKEIRRYNNIKRGTKPRPGEKIYLEKSKSK